MVLLIAKVKNCYKVFEEYSNPGMVTNNEWNKINVKFFFNRWTYAINAI